MQQSKVPVVFTRRPKVTGSDLSHQKPLSDHAIRDGCDPETLIPHPQRGQQPHNASPSGLQAATSAHHAHAQSTVSEAIRAQPEIPQQRYLPLFPQPRTSELHAPTKAKSLPSSVPMVRSGGPRQLGSSMQRPSLDPPRQQPLPLQHPVVGAERAPQQGSRLGRGDPIPLRLPVPMGPSSNLERSVIAKSSMECVLKNPCSRSDSKGGCGEKRLKPTEGFDSVSGGDEDGEDRGSGDDEDGLSSDGGKDGSGSDGSSSGGSDWCEDSASVDDASDEVRQGGCRQGEACRGGQARGAGKGRRQGVEECCNAG